MRFHSFVVQLSLLTLFILFQCSHSQQCGARYNKRTPRSGRYGYANKARGARIVGGTKALTGDFPWIVSLQLYGSHFCGGSIINKNWIVTAGHCAKDKSGTVRTGIVVKAGTMTPDDGTEHKVVKVVVRPEFTYDTFAGDISLMRVSPPFQFNEGDDGEGAITPVCLPGYEDEFEGTATVAGWGYHFSGQDEISENLMALDVNLLQPEDCSYYKIFTKKGMLCAGYVEGKKDACQGDSGGPLTSLDEDDRATLIGVVSYGEGCAEANKPGLYTRVSHYVRWIKQTTGVR